LPDVLIPAGLAEQLRAARRVAALTGSGISAESGVPTFRDAQTGLWARYDPHELATPGAFQRNPKLVWQWYRWRRKLIARARPNPAHQALVGLEARHADITLVTQNVDGLHHAAGSRNVLELHGNIGRARCTAEGVVVSEPPDGPEVPLCPRCGAALRPDVVWFGEALPAGLYAKAEEAARRCDLFLTIGTSALVQPAASLPLLAAERRATVVEINLERTPFSPCASHVLLGPAAELLPALVARAFPD
jgi:NAD-dependent deacetylase